MINILMITCFVVCFLYKYPCLGYIVRQYSKKAKRATASSNGLAGIWLYISSRLRTKNLSFVAMRESEFFFIQILDDGSDELNLLWDISAIQTHYFLHKNVWVFIQI